VIVHFVDIGGINDHQFLFIIQPSFVFYAIMFLCGIWKWSKIHFQE